MRFEVLKDDFQKALQLVQLSVSSRSVMPILSGVVLDAHGDGVKVYTTDLESSTTTYCAANVEDEGSCVVNHKILLELSRDFKDEKMVLELTGNELQVVGENNVFKIFTMPKDDFPTPPEVGTLVIDNLEPSLFSRSVQVVSKAASRDEKRPTLTGIYMDFDGEEMRLVSTDSYRLAIKKIREGFRAEERGSYIIPAAPLHNFSRHVNENGAIKVFRDDNAGQLKFYDGNTGFTVRLIEGKFPRYEQFIPESMEKMVEVAKEDLLSALKRASLVNSIIKLQVEPGRIILNSESRDVGEGRETLAVDYEGEPVTIAFNGKFLEDGITSVEGDTVVMGINEPLKPGVIKEKGSEDFIYIIMPVRI
ncbi:DNA polymerase III subunit beta [Candidatus Solincola sp.]|nr:DNA polymerase III subunit beta [Actinomycetota bacterium]MDI7253065.1 DNA polymerase III subunit beta [Actinomycetota bacterium]